MTGKPKYNPFSNRRKKERMERPDLTGIEHLIGIWLKYTYALERHHSQAGDNAQMKQALKTIRSIGARKSNSVLEALEMAKVANSCLKNVERKE